MRGAQRNRVLAAILAVMLSAQAGAAIELTSLPERSLQTLDERLGFDSFVLPVGAYTDGAMATITAEGAVRRRTWQVNGDGLSTLQIIAPLRDEITAAGYETLLSCETDSCGGFDFRYAISVLPAPEMHVDLFDFRVFTARRVDPAQPERGQYLYLLVSRTRSAGFVQLFESNAAQSGGDAAPRAAKDPRVAPAAVPSAGVVKAPASDLTRVLIAQGHVILSGLEFATGADDLQDGLYPQLDDLADFLNGDAARRVMLVGHTDSEGSLAANTALSRRRAQSVARRLVERHGAPRGQISAQGAGFLAPVASNLIPDGREANRRVEVILLGME